MVPSIRFAVLILRGVQALFSVLVLGLIAYVATWWSSHWQEFSPHEVNFLIFSPVWTLLVLAVLVAVPWRAPHIAEQTIPRIILLVLEVWTMLNWFGGFIAAFIFLNDRICFGTVCACAKAGVAFSVFSWFTWAVTTGFSVTQVFKAMRGVRRNSNFKPEMHQGV